MNRQKMLRIGAALFLISCVSVQVQGFLRPAQQTITIGFMGDVMIGRMVNELLASTPATYPWGDMRSFLVKNDINIINFEATLTKHTQAVPKVFNFKSDPKNVAVLHAGNIAVVTLANNHSLDFGPIGLRDTLQALDDAGILHVGAGATIADAKKAVVITKNGITIGIIGYTDNEPGWLAQTNKPGTNYIKVGDIETVKKDIASVRSQVDILIFTMHWGPNMRQKPSAAFQQFAHQLIDAGVDIFHGHSAHLFQGVEIYKDKLIMYDTGDFIDDYAVGPQLRNDQSFLFLVTLQKNRQCGVFIRDLKLIPVIIQAMQVNQAKGVQAQEILDRMKKLSSDFGTRVGDSGLVKIHDCR